MAQTPIVQKTPNLSSKPQVYFNRSDFNALIYTHGYNVIAEKAIRCPCSSLGNSPIPTCQTCGGTGFFYTNAIECRALITGVNNDTEYKAWSPELIGTIAITVDSNQRSAIEYYSRLVLKDEYAVWTEVLDMRTVKSNKFVFCTYAPIEVLSAWVYVDEYTPLRKLSESEYSISLVNPYVIEVLPTVTTPNGSISLCYKHRLEYNIIDIPHEVRASRELKKSGQISKQDMPVQGIGRLAHLIVGNRPNFDGSGVINY